MINLTDQERLKFGQWCKQESRRSANIARNTTNLPGMPDFVAPAMSAEAAAYAFVARELQGCLGVPREPFEIDFGPEGEHEAQTKAEGPPASGEEDQQESEGST